VTSTGKITALLISSAVHAREIATQ